MPISLARAVQAVERHGLLLVYPVQNRADPPSLWSALHPRTPMRWSWDDGADGRVVELWHLRARLAASRRVVYGKWLGGRAMFASRPVFGAMLAAVRAKAGPDVRRGLTRDAQTLLEILEDDSPQGTRALREAADLSGRSLEPAFVAAMRELWSRFLVVGAGEADEGGFPSLTVGATSLLFEDVWADAASPDEARAARLAEVLARSKSLARSFARVVGGVERSTAPGLGD